jgi:patatin-like phospholipase/acyl hydrolase
MPFYFSSRKALETLNLNFKLTDVCRATSAGPTYLPAHGLWEPRRMICVDGGVFQNNPTITGLVEVLKFPDIYNNGHPINFDDIFVLSIGTGRYNKTIPSRHAYNGGELNWVKPVIDLSMWGNSQAVDEHMTRLFLLGSRKKHYLRINVRILEERFADMAISSREAMDYYTERAAIDYLNNAEVQAELDQWLIDSKVI